MSALAILMLVLLTMWGGWKVYHTDNTLEAVPITLQTAGCILAMLAGSLPLAIGIHTVLVLQYALLPTPDQRERQMRYPDNSLLVVGTIVVVGELILWSLFQWIR